MTNNSDDPLIAEIEKIEQQKRRLKCELMFLRDKISILREEAERRGYFIQGKQEQKEERVRE